MFKNELLTAVLAVQVVSHSKLLAKHACRFYWNKQNKQKLHFSTKVFRQKLLTQIKSLKASSYIICIRIIAWKYSKHASSHTSPNLYTVKPGHTLVF